MKIPKKYSEFIKKETLIILCGRQESKVFSIKDDVIEKVIDFKMKNPEYSDKEGFFQTRTKNIGVIKSGAVYEGMKEKIKNDFFKKLKNELKKVSYKRENNIIHLFSSAHLKNDIKEIATKIFPNKNIFYYNGNFYHQDFFDALEVIRKERTPKKEIRNKEAKKILEKSKIARKIIKGKP